MSDGKHQDPGSALLLERQLRANAHDRASRAFRNLPRGEKLQRMRSAGVLSEAEYAAQLGKLGS